MVDGESYAAVNTTAGSFIICSGMFKSHSNDLLPPHSAISCIESIEYQSFTVCAWVTADDESL